MFSLSFDLGAQITNPSLLFSSLAGNMVGPIFNKGRIDKSIEIEEEKFNQLVIEYKQGYLLAFQEVEDALNDKSVADMSRAKQIKSLFRMVTPKLTLKDIPMVVVNHTYKEMSLFPKDIVSGGTGAYYSADNIYIIGRQQEKQGKDVVGYNFIINVEKSRHVREKSKIPVNVSTEGGISRWSGLLDIAIEGGFVVKPNQGWYSRVVDSTGEVEEKRFRIKDTNTADFWSGILASDKFNQYIKKTYKLATGSIMMDEE